MNFEKLKKKAAEAAESIADKGMIFAKKAADKTKAAAKIAKLTAEIATEKESIKKNYAEIGRLYYEKFKDNPDEELAQAVSEISISMAIIESKKAEIEEFKAGDAADFEEAPDEEAPEEAPAADEAPKDEE